MPESSCAILTGPEKNIFVSWEVMAGFPDAVQISRALERAREALELTTDRLLWPNEINVFLQYLLLEGLEEDELEAWRFGRGERSNLPRRLTERLGELDSDRGLPRALRLPSNAPLYRSRLLELARDRVLSERLAPEICLCPKTLPHGLSPPLGTHVHAVIYGASKGFAHEFYPLVVDAYAHDAERYGEPRFQVLGVRFDGLSQDGFIQRAIVFDPERNLFLEGDLHEPLYPDSVHFLCLGERERELHADWAARFSCPQINPLPSSALADDKTATLLAWVARDVAIPRFRKIEPGDWNRAAELLSAWPELVVKPNRGTEGRGVSYCRSTNINARIELRRALEACWQDDDAALLQERRDGVLFRDPATGNRHTLALRLNGVFDGVRYRLASGFAQIGIDVEHPASRGRGGRMVSLAEVWPNLVARQSPEKSLPSPDEIFWSQLEASLERATGVFEGLMLIGLDVVLDLNERGELEPIFLEANPRPAGLCHSRLLSALPSRKDPPGVGTALWDGLTASSVCRSCPPLSSFVQKLHQHDGQRQYQGGQVSKNDGHGVDVDAVN
jgi:hypothetical protein